MQGNQWHSEAMIPLTDFEALPADLQAAWERSLQRRGEARFIAGAGHAPWLYRWYGEEFYGRLFHGGDAPVRYKELGRLRLSRVHGCRSCNRGNRLDAAERGLSRKQIDNIQNAAHPSFDAADRAVLALADLLSLDNESAAPDAALYGQLRAHFSDAQIFEMGMVFGLLTGMARFLFAFGLVEKEPYCRF